MVFIGLGSEDSAKSCLNISESPRFCKPVVSVTDDDFGFADTPRAHFINQPGTLWYTSTFHIWLDNLSWQ